MANEQKDFIIIGASIIDVLVSPANSQVFQSGSFSADCIVMHTGGDALNEATVLSSLGASVRLVSKFGCDFAGTYLMEHCRRQHMDTSFITQDSSIDTGINVVLVESSGERHFLTSSSGSLRKFYPDDILDTALDNGTYVCFASIFVSPYFNDKALSGLFSKCRKKGLIVCADLTKRKNGETLNDMAESFSYLDYVFPNYEEASLLTGFTDLDDIADAFISCGVRHVIIKTGSDGCFIKTKQERHLISAVPDITCVDTTGAGDTFTACFLYALNQNMNLPQCGRFANLGASVCIQHIGATGGIQTLSDIQTFDN